MSLPTQLAKVTFLFLVVFTSQAQLPANKEIGYLYKKSFGMGAQISTTGWEVNGNYRKIFTPKHNAAVRLGFAHLKGPKEFRTRNPEIQNSKSYVFGKVNTALTMNLGLEYQRTLFEKKRKFGVSMSYFVGGGLNLVYYKPIYMLIRHEHTHEEPHDPEELKYDPENQSPSTIYGRSSHFSGWNEGSFMNGVNAIGGFEFDFNRKEDIISAIRIGMTVDGFKNSVPLYHFGQNKSTFVGLFIGLQIGLKKLQ